MDQEARGGGVGKKRFSAEVVGRRRKKKRPALEPKKRQKAK